MEMKTIKEFVMYLPKHFEQNNWQQALELIETASFAQLISIDSDQQLQISYLPVLFDKSQQHFIFHLSGQNEHCDLLSSTVSQIIFNGPHSYISPNWADDILVPTWNYTAVHISGKAVEIIDQDAKFELMSQMVGFYESTMSKPWSIDALTDKQRKGMFNAIRCYTLKVDSWQAKYKLSQNRSELAVQQLAEKLQTMATLMPQGENEKALAQLMLAQANDI